MKKIIEKIKNKTQAFKAETKREKVLTFDEFLQEKNAQNTVESRAEYTQYKLDLDTKNKNADMKLSRFLGTALFLIVFFVAFSFACCQSIGATPVSSHSGYVLYDEPLSTYITPNMNLAINSDDECTFTYFESYYSYDDSSVRCSYCTVTNGEYFYNLIQSIFSSDIENFENLSV